MAEPKFVSWSEELEKSEFPYFLSYRDLTLLNMLAPIYHSGLGYVNNEIYPPIDIISSYKTNLIPNLVDREEDDCVHVNVNNAEKFSHNYKLRHKIITIRLCAKKQQAWDKKPNMTNKTIFHKQISTPKYWYEFPSEIFRSFNVIGALSDRKYIYVIDTFVEIELQSSEKDDPLTIDDVLFACRGVCGDDTRSIEYFNILSDDGSKLVLMPYIDNWST